MFSIFDLIKVLAAGAIMAAAVAAHSPYAEPYAENLKGIWANMSP